MCVCKGRHGDAIDRQAEVMYFLKPVGLFVLLSFFLNASFWDVRSDYAPGLIGRYTFSVAQYRVEV